MLPQRSSVLEPNFGPDFTVDFSHGEPNGAKPAERYSQVCPTCSHQFSGHHCKLVCTQCGYYLSCADYY
jgi:hypothetical protein